MMESSIVALNCWITSAFCYLTAILTYSSFCCGTKTDCWVCCSAVITCLSAVCEVPGLTAIVASVFDTVSTDTYHTVPEMTVSSRTSLWPPGQTLALALALKCLALASVIKSVPWPWPRQSSPWPWQWSRWCHHCIVNILTCLISHPLFT